MDCRPGCGACCIAISISSPLPGMPDGKPASIPCVNLDDTLCCRLHGGPDYPSVCSGLKPSAQMCGTSRSHAMDYLTLLERLTLPDS